MRKLLAASAIALSSAYGHATELNLPGEKWIAKFDKFICTSFDVGSTPDAAPAPQPFADYSVNFEQVTSDSTLDNAKLAATFVENGKTCRYNAILLADNDAQTFQFVQSIAFAPEVTENGSGYAACAEGKAFLDKALAGNKYLYYGHPHNLAFVMTGVGAEAVCKGATTIGANFVVTGRINR